MREDTQSSVTPSGVPLFGPLSLFWFSTIPPSGFPLFPLSGFPLDTLAQTNTHTHTLFGENRSLQAVEVSVPLKTLRVVPLRV